MIIGRPAKGGCCCDVINAGVHMMTKRSAIGGCCCDVIMIFSVIV